MIKLLLFIITIFLGIAFIVILIQKKDKKNDSIHTDKTCG